MNNIKYLVLLLCGIFLSHISQAQISIGLKGGYTNAWEDYGDIGLPENAEIDINTLNVYLLTSFELNKYIDFAIEPGFIQRGAACVPGWQPIFEGDTKFYLSYVDLPVFVQGNLPLFNEKIDLFGRLGYGLAYMVKAVREEVDFNSDEPAPRFDMDFSLFNRLDHGVHAAAGAAYNFGNQQLFVESAFYRGMLDAEINNVSKNNNININLGYRYKL